MRTTAWPKTASGREVMQKGACSVAARQASASSACTLMPPVLMTLSARPVTRKRPQPSVTAMSVVVSGSGQRCGASMTSCPLWVSEMATPGSGVYHSEASVPLMRLMATCESVSVMP